MSSIGITLLDQFFLFTVMRGLVVMLCDHLPCGYRMNFNFTMRPGRRMSLTVILGIAPRSCDIHGIRFLPIVSKGISCSIECPHTACTTDIGLMCEGDCKQSLQVETWDQEHRVQPAYISINIKSRKKFYCHIFVCYFIYRQHKKITIFHTNKPSLLKQKSEVTHDVVT